MGKGKKKKKRRDRGSSGSQKSPQLKKPHVESVHNMADSASDTDSESSTESVHSDDITNLARELVVVVEEQKELILNVSKKQNEISKEMKKMNGKF